MRIFKKKLTIRFAVAIAFVVAALAYSMGYKMAMKKFNDIVAYNQEKERMYFKLSEVDKTIRQEYIGDIDETKLISGICSGYISSLEGSLCKYLSNEGYREYISNKDFDENAVVYENIGSEAGYIKICAVTSEAGNMFYNALKSLYSENIQKFVIDIRNLNGKDLETLGKCLDVVSNPADIISTVGKKGEKETVYKVNSDSLDLRISVITNNSTEGTPELIASALKDSGKGKVVGEKTKGRAVLEKVFVLSDGSAIIYPSAHYVTQGGKIFTGTGVEPDVLVELSEEKQNLLKQGELSRENDDQFLEALKILD